MKSPAAKEVPICTAKAVRALFQARPTAIRRLFFDAERGRSFGLVCRYLAAHRKVYRQVEPAELERIAGTVHHGGIVAIAELPPLRAPAAGDLARWARAGRPVLVLDRIGNAHNLGALVRSAAFFGIEHLVLARHPQQALPGESAYRVAEGGFEHLTVWQVEELTGFLRALAAAGFAVVGADVRGAPLAAMDRAALAGDAVRPLALVLGNEEQGLAPAIAEACTRLVRIPGRGAVESLNVSAAGAVLLAAATAGGTARSPGGRPARGDGFSPARGR